MGILQLIALDRRSAQSAKNPVSAVSATTKPFGRYIDVLCTKKLLFIFVAAPGFLHKSHPHGVVPNIPLLQ
jgi:hypothetical protein